MFKIAFLGLFLYSTPFFSATPGSYSSDVATVDDDLVRILVVLGVEHVVPVNLLAGEGPKSIDGCQLVLASNGRHIMIMPAENFMDESIHETLKSKGLFYTTKGFFEAMVRADCSSKLNPNPIAVFDHLTFKSLRTGIKPAHLSFFEHATLMNLIRLMEIPHIEDVLTRLYNATSDFKRYGFLEIMRGLVLKAIEEDKEPDNFPAIFREAESIAAPFIRVKHGMSDAPAAAGGGGAAASSGASAVELTMSDFKGLGDLVSKHTVAVMEKLHTKGYSRADKVLLLDTLHAIKTGNIHTAKSSIQRMGPEVSMTVLSGATKVGGELVKGDTKQQAMAKWLRLLLEDVMTAGSAGASSTTSYAGTAYSAPAAAKLKAQAAPARSSAASDEASASRRLASKRDAAATAPGKASGSSAVCVTPAIAAKVSVALSAVADGKKPEVLYAAAAYAASPAVSFSGAAAAAMRSPTPSKLYTQEVIEDILTRTPPEILTALTLRYAGRGMDFNEIIWDAFRNGTIDELRAASLRSPSHSHSRMHASSDPAAGAAVVRSISRAGTPLRTQPFSVIIPEAVQEEYDATLDSYGDETSALRANFNGFLAHVQTRGLFELQRDIEKLVDGSGYSYRLNDRLRIVFDINTAGRTVTIIKGIDHYKK